jgi:solute:Na+ symporter, SSS family
MVTGTLMALSSGFKTSVYELNIFGISVSAYEAIFALVVNLAVAVLLTGLLSVLGARRGRDETSPDDYRERSERPAAHPALAS